MGSSSQAQVDRMEVELNQMALQRLHLSDRRDLLAVLLDFRRSSDQRRAHPGGDGSSAEVGAIDEQLAALALKEEELQKSIDQILHPKGQPATLPDHTNFIPKGGVFIMPPVMEEPVVAPPPPMSAPKVILDHRKLPSTPSHTQCPFCHQFITTETVTRVGSVTWLVCVMSALLGCVAGCCLIPFCVPSLKDVEHRCPKCRAEIYTVRKL
ncbi:hypothetical protein AAFF_G00212680 [Aldrovandia affinis]|uniref:LITAF domain-containing protein n=1 Tax=Aldrovandia affinis TaxID=143900 RepID=A0AAD7RH07_9TELE|nr:hypothetical protein AAFF_G00212680 [Aldrovandia affinis]